MKKIKVHDLSKIETRECNKCKVESSSGEVCYCFCVCECACYCGCKCSCNCSGCGCSCGCSCNCLCSCDYSNVKEEISDNPYSVEASSGSATSSSNTSSSNTDALPTTSGNFSPPPSNQQRDTSVNSSVNAADSGSFDGSVSNPRDNQTNIDAAINLNFLLS